MIKKLITASTIISFLLSSGAVALADTSTAANTNVSTAVSTSSTQPVGKPLDIACMQNAVEKRDNAVISALDGYHATVRAALVARRDALKAAWAVTDPDARAKAINSAWDAFRGTWRNAAHTLNAARKSAWDQFNTDRKACGDLIEVTVRIPSPAIEKNKGKEGKEGKDHGRGMGRVMREIKRMIRWEHPNEDRRTDEQL